MKSQEETAREARRRGAHRVLDDERARARLAAQRAAGKADGLRQAHEPLAEIRRRVDELVRRLTLWAKQPDEQTQAYMEGELEAYALILAVLTPPVHAGDA